MFRGKKNHNNAQGVVAKEGKLIIHVPSSPALRPVSTLINYAKSKAPKISQPPLILLRESLGVLYVMDVNHRRWWEARWSGKCWIERQRRNFGEALNWFPFRSRSSKRNFPARTKGSDTFHICFLLEKRRKHQTCAYHASWAPWEPVRRFVREMRFEKVNNKSNKTIEFSFWLSYCSARCLDIYSIAFPSFQLYEASNYRRTTSKINYEHSAIAIPQKYVRRAFRARFLTIAPL